MTCIGVAIIHGMGRQSPDFADDMVSRLRRRFADEMRPFPSAPADPAAALAIQPVHWAPALQEMEDDLWERANAAASLGWSDLRQFMISFMADAIAYQRMPDDHAVYDSVHEHVAAALKQLATAQGMSPTSPLVIIAHSLGTIIASNYVYDLQVDTAAIRAGGSARLVSPPVQQVIDAQNTPMARGETLTALYTLGSPLAIWSLRYPGYGRPIDVPSPQMNDHYPPARFPELRGEWINFFDVDDVIAWPLKPLGPHYDAAVTRDEQVHAGGLLTGWTPLSHDHYWTDSEVLRPIARSLAGIWRAINP